MEKIFLFDMDGTLTPARKSIDVCLSPFMKLAEHNKVGIVSGSNIDYILEQMRIFIELFPNVLENVDLLPCNGTSRYVYDKDASEYQLVETVNMRKEIGNQRYRELVHEILTIQLKNAHHFNCLTGTFLQFRGSMLNWCPIGRDANDDDRKKFESKDFEFELRKDLITQLKHSSFYRDDELQISLGGKTSIDIFPKGWDKTYCLKYYQKMIHYFVGDSCHIGGNDYEIYNTVKKSFKVNNDMQTVQLIYDFIGEKK